MNQFETVMHKFSDEAKELQKEEMIIKTEAQLLSGKENITEDEEFSIMKRELSARKKAHSFNVRLMGYLRECGLPENYTMPELCILAIKKARESVIEVIG